MASPSERSVGSAASSSSASVSDEKKTDALAALPPAPSAALPPTPPLDVSPLQDLDADGPMLAELRAQLEYYFSPTNLLRDYFLCGIMADRRLGTTSCRVAPLSVVARFKNVTSIVARHSPEPDRAAVLRAVVSAALTSEKLVCAGEFVGPVGDVLGEVAALRARQGPEEKRGESSPKGPPEEEGEQRKTVILREVPAGTDEGMVRALFGWEGCPPVSAARSDVGGFWFVTLDGTNEQVVSAVLKLSMDKMKLHGAPVRARLKADNKKRATYTPSTGATLGGPPRTPAPFVLPYAPGHTHRAHPGQYFPQDRHYSKAAPFRGGRDAGRGRGRGPPAMGRGPYPPGPGVGYAYTPNGSFRNVGKGEEGHRIGHDGAPGAPGGYQGQHPRHRGPRNAPPGGEGAGEAPPKKKAPKTPVVPVPAPPMASPKYFPPLGRQGGMVVREGGAVPHLTGPLVVRRETAPVKAPVPSSPVPPPPPPVTQSAVPSSGGYAAALLRPAPPSPKEGEEGSDSGGKMSEKVKQPPALTKKPPALPKKQPAATATSSKQKPAAAALNKSNKQPAAAASSKQKPAAASSNKQHPAKDKLDPLPAPSASKPTQLRPAPSPLPAAPKHTSPPTRTATATALPRLGAGPKLQPPPPADASPRGVASGTSAPPAPPASAAKPVWGAKKSFAEILRAGERS